MISNNLLFTRIFLLYYNVFFPLFRSTIFIHFPIGLSFLLTFWAGPDLAELVGLGPPCRVKRVRYNLLDQMGLSVLSGGGLLV